MKATGSVTDSNKAKYELVGRKLVCLAHPFGSPRTAINVGLKVKSGREGELNIESLEIQQQHRFYEATLTHSLGLAEELNNRMEASELQDICTWGMSDQRSTDLGSVKHAGLAYLLADGKSLEPSITKLEDKLMCGFNHPQIARMLCPRKKLDVFDEDPDIIIGALQEGTIRTTAANWPTCFYEEGIYDLENRAKGLFCGHAAFRFYTHLFIGPSAVSTNSVTSNTSKISKNRAWGLTEVTPSIIAYVHVVDKDDWTKRTLAWWNSRAFPKGHASCKDADSDDDMAKIRAQRAHLSKKPARPSKDELRAAEAIEFATPPSKNPSVPLPASKNLNNPTLGNSENPSIQSSEAQSIETQSELDSSTTTISSVFSAATAAGMESNLSPCTSDNEAGSTWMAYYKTTNSAVASTSTTTSLPAPAPLSDPSTSGPVEPEKKGRAVATKKPHRRGGKKSNGF
ncbi:hypothetical protein J3R83DRAFT_5288 [Lanmaoa asiatica]|nr:hypothetical protein J3R83DRAFT_5288 [Lanmaoa asiatica]